MLDVGSVVELEKGNEETTLTTQKPLEVSREESIHKRKKKKKKKKKCKNNLS